MEREVRGGVIGGTSGERSEGKSDRRGRGKRRK